MRQSHFVLYDPVFGDSPALQREALPTLQLQSSPPVSVLLVRSTLRRNSYDRATAYTDKARGFGGHATVATVALRHGQINADASLSESLTTDIANFIRAPRVH